MKITTEVIENELGWQKISDNIYMKIPYPYIIKYDPDTKKYYMMDRYFSEDHSQTEISNVSEYDRIIIPILKETQKLNELEIVEYQVNDLINSYKISLSKSLNKIENLDPIVKENQIRTFLKESFPSKGPIFKAEKLEQFLKIKTHNGNMSFIEARLEEDKKLFDELKAKIQITLQHLKCIYKNAKPHIHII